MKLDVRGAICPYPVKKIVEALDRLPAGEALEILTDHPPSLVLSHESRLDRLFEEVGPVRPGR